MIGCQELSQDDLNQNVEKHQITDLAIVTYQRIFAWNLQSPVKFPNPQRFLQKKGARIWVNLEFPRNAEHVQNLRGSLDNCSTEGDLFELAQKGEVVPFPKYKTPYFRIMDKVLSIQEKFFFVSENFASAKSALGRALQFQWHVKTVVDDVECMLDSGMKSYLEDNSLSKSGSSDTLRGRVAAHKVSVCRKKWHDASKTVVKHEPAVIAAAAELPSSNNSAQEPQELPGSDGSMKGSMVCRYFDSWL